MENMMMAAPCVACAIPAPAGIRVEIDGPDRTDRTCRIAADEFFN